MTKILGLDLSLTGTGVTEESGTRTIKTSPKQSDEERLHYISQTILNLDKPDLVIVEGLAFASHTGKATERAGLWWLIKIGFWLKKIPVVVVPPTSLKRYVCGKGNAQKDAVMLTVAGRYGKFFNPSNNNESDSIGLYAMAKDYLGETLVEVPALNRSALDKIQWPEIK